MFGTIYASPSPPICRELGIGKKKNELGDEENFGVRGAGFNFLKNKFCGCTNQYKNISLQVIYVDQFPHLALPPKKRKFVRKEFIPVKARRGMQQRWNRTALSNTYSTGTTAFLAVELHDDNKILL